MSRANFSCATICCSMNEQNRIEIGSFYCDSYWVRVRGWCAHYLHIWSPSLYLSFYSPLSKHNVSNKLKEKNHVSCYIAGCVRILIFALGRTVSCRDANFLVVNMVFRGSRKQTNRFLISDNDSDMSDGRFKVDLNID